MLTMFGVQNLRKKSKRDYNTDLQAIIARLVLYNVGWKDSQKRINKNKSKFLRFRKVFKQRKRLLEFFSI